MGQVVTTAGQESSEYAIARRAQLIGEALLALSLLAAVLGGVTDRMTVVVVAVGFALAGALTIAGPVVGYARSRGEVKAAASTPPAQVTAVYAIGQRRL